MVKNGNAEIVRLLSLDMVPFVTIRYQIRLPILKQPVLIYPLRPFLQPDLSEISHISPKPGKKQFFNDEMYYKQVIYNLYPIAIC